MFLLDQLVKITKTRKRVGRGGKRGGTSGKGHKGQKARAGGYVRRGYEGGQMPLHRRLPKRGFNNAPFRKEQQIVNLAAFDKHFEAGETITKQSLHEKGLINDATVRLKVLGNQVHKKFTVHAEAFSAGALAALAKVGGEAKVVVEG